MELQPYKRTFKESASKQKLQEEASYDSFEDDIMEGLFPIVGLIANIDEVYGTDSIQFRKIENHYLVIKKEVEKMIRSLHAMKYEFPTSK